MRRVLLALDMQQFYKPSEGQIQQINRVGEHIPVVATLFEHDEHSVPYKKLTERTGPEGETCMVNAEQVFTHHGYQLPQQLKNWLVEQNVEEAIVAGGHHDANILSAGFCLFDLGIKPILVPQLCYGNRWYEHTVTFSIWEHAFGPVLENVVELGVPA